MVARPNMCLFNCNGSALFTTKFCFNIMSMCLLSMAHLSYFRAQSAQNCRTQIWYGKRKQSSCRAHNLKLKHWEIPSPWDHCFLFTVVLDSAWSQIVAVAIPFMNAAPFWGSRPGKHYTINLIEIRYCFSKKADSQRTAYHVGDWRFSFQNMIFRRWSCAQWPFFIHLYNMNWIFVRRQSQGATCNLTAGENFGRTLFLDIGHFIASSHQLKKLDTTIFDFLPKIHQ